MELPFSTDELREATLELIRRTGFPAATSGRSRSSATARWASYAPDAPVDVMIAVGSGARTSARRASATASAPRSRRGARIAHQPDPASARPRGQYVNSILAKTESVKAGYDEAILLDDQGYVSEGSGENIFVV